VKHSPHIALCFINYGPYHLARLDACLARGLAVTGLQLAPLQSEYDWKPMNSAALSSVFNGKLESVSGRQWHSLVFAALDRLDPEVCAVAGYGHPGMRSILLWCMRRKRSVVMMSDSRQEDHGRFKWKELLKSLIVRSCSAGLVAGTPHVGYLKSLGLPKEKIFTGYDVVDNQYFKRRANEAREQREELRAKYGLPKNYFLASARFIEKKNLSGLLQAYAKYHQKASLAAEACGTLPWKLVLLGDGPLRAELSGLVSALGLQSSVILPGFIQYEELPVYYGLAQAFMLASHTMEQWGLVVNEAMASGLPVLVSKACGCMADLVREGRNGFTFDPYDAEEIADLMLKIAGMTPEQRSEMGEVSREIISDWEPARFADGVKRAVDCVPVAGPKRVQILDLLSTSLLSACL
jgi:glycosyltransferase involved in cell wall biosynthesis